MLASAKVRTRTCVGLDMNVQHAGAQGPTTIDDTTVWVASAGELGIGVSLFAL